MDLASVAVSAYEVDSPLTSGLREIYSAFATRLQQSRICMFDSSVGRKSISKCVLLLCQELPCVSLAQLAISAIKDLLSLELGQNGVCVFALSYDMQRAAC